MTRSFRLQESAKRHCRLLLCLGMASCLLASGCDTLKTPSVKPLPGPIPLPSAESSLSDSIVGSGATPDNVQYSYGQAVAPRYRTSARHEDVAGNISLNFADTDIRDAVSQVLGDILHVNYSIDPAVKGRVTLHTASPLTESQLFPALQILLEQVHATITRIGTLYRIVPAQGDAGGGASGSLADGSYLGGSIMVPLRYADATSISKMLQPFLQSGARAVPVASANTMLVSVDPTARNTVVALIRSFDVDWLSGQSYALLPVESGNARDVATTLQSALHGASPSLTQAIQVLPMTRVNAVLVVAPSARYIDDARRLFALIMRNRRANMRSWHVFYVQNSNVNDIAYTLQQAFTPENVTAMPPEAQNSAGQTSQGFNSGGMAGGFSNGLGGAVGNNLSGGNSSNFLGMNGASSPLLGGAPSTAGGATAANAATANPLLGGLDSTANGASGHANEMRIISNGQHDAVLVYATEQESDNVAQMLRKIDIMPLQVRIDAVIAEVQLNDALQYGTQFFFKSGGINGVLSNNNQQITVGTLATSAFSHTLPGFIIGGASGGGAPFAIDALQSVTTVHVLSSPQLMVLDNRPARLQVGQLVPVQTGSQSSTIGTSIYNQFNYQPTGVIMQVTPRVNDNGLVTLDIEQEVSSVNPTSTSTINPTFDDRSVTSRVVVQDGQTVGLAGLITDSSSRGNSGIPWLKNIPILGILAGNQTNNHQRTELLILITPHVIHDQHDAVSLMEDLRETHPNAANVPDELHNMRESGSPDPQRLIREKVGLGP
ncbi:type II secretion system secretin GspD [Neoasaia chiangmaiensis]|uniref:type II secretion system secretin GspD n=1 Tax=Neoasaia chiangmaiensis TaxID=320497 RepID=UPI00098AE5C4|nr:type II secretion system secretin GspD [Neoasaia chiangmaiensis]